MFIDFFCSPNNLQGQIFTDFILGQGGRVQVSFWNLNAHGIVQNIKKEIILYGVPSYSISLNPDGIARTHFKVESLDSNLTINQVANISTNPETVLKEAQKKDGYDAVGNLPFNGNIQQVRFYCTAYSSDTLKWCDIKFSK